MLQYDLSSFLFSFHLLFILSFQLFDIFFYFYALFSPYFCALVIKVYLYSYFFLYQSCIMVMRLRGLYCSPESQVNDALSLFLVVFANILLQYDSRQVSAAAAIFVFSLFPIDDKVIFMIEFLGSCLHHAMFIGVIRISL